MILDDCLKEVFEESSDDEEVIFEVKYAPKGFPAPKKIFKRRPSTDSIETITQETVAAKNQSINYNIYSNAIPIIAPNLTAESKGTVSSQYDMAGNLTEEGYTLMELLEKCKSTLEVQRTLGLSVFLKIFKNHEISTPELLLATRTCLDSNSITLQELALETIILSIPTTELNVFDECIHNFTGNNTKDIDGSVGNILELLESDPVMGYLLTHVLTRLKHLLKYSSLDKLSIFRLLTLISKHSSSSAEDILSEIGLIDEIQTQIAQIIFPFKDDSWMLVCNVLELFKTIAKSSRTSCEALINNSVIDSMLKFITIPHPHNNVYSHTFELLGVCFQYGLGSGFIDIWRQIFTDFQLLLIKQFNENIAFNFMIKSALETFPMLDPGGPHDQFLPYIQNTLFSLKNEGSGLDLVNVYVEKVGRSECSYEAKGIIADLAEMKLETKIDFEIFDKLYANVKSCFKSSEYIKALKQFCEWFSKTKSVLNSMKSLLKLGYISNSILDEFLLKLEPVSKIDFNNFMSKSDINRMYSKPIFDLFDLLIESKMQVDLFMVLEWLLPGLDYMIPKLLDKIVKTDFEYLTTRDCVEFSLAVNRIDHTLSPPMLFIDINKKFTALPFGENFFYEYPKGLKFGNVNGVEGWLDMVISIENASKDSNKNDSFKKLLSMMCLFFLTTKDGKTELYQIDTISQRIAELFKVLIPSYEEFCKQDIDFDSFAQFYEELLECYDTTSYGDIMFSRIILLPTCNVFPDVFREMFWMKLQLGVFRLKLSDLWWDVKVFKKGGRGLEKCFEGVLKRGKINAIDNEVLFSIIGGNDNK
jgi:hypothetical protein